MDDIPSDCYDILHLGDLNRLKQIVSSGKLNININYRYGDSRMPVLCLVCKTYNGNKKQLDTIRWLLENGADVNAADTHGFSALHEACSPEKIFKDRVDLIRLLLSQPNININARTFDSQKISPIDWVISDTSFNLIDQLVDWMTCITLLIRKGAKVDLTKKVPDWVKNILDYRRNCKRAALLLIGIKRFGRSPVLNSNNKDITHLIVEHMLTTQIDPVWKDKSIVTP